MVDRELLESPLAVIADADIASVFRALGFKPYALSDTLDFVAIVKDVIAKNIAICLVQDHIYRTHRAIIDNYKNFALPIFIPFAKDMHSDLLEKIVKDIKLRATGVI
jgi:vacuolar-type H+-ATPase subunit F/Vma7